MSEYLFLNDNSTAIAALKDGYLEGVAVKVDKSELVDVKEFLAMDELGTAR